MRLLATQSELRSPQHVSDPGSSIPLHAAVIKVLFEQLNFTFLVAMRRGIEPDLVSLSRPGEFTPWVRRIFSKPNYQIDHLIVLILFSWRRVADGPVGAEPSVHPPRAGARWHLPIASRKTTPVHAIAITSLLRGGPGLSQWKDDAPRHAVKMS